MKKFLLSGLKSRLMKMLASGTSPNKLAMSCSIGMYIAFSPFPGAHTIMMIAAQWMFRLNFPALFFFTSLNNPWTMIPFFSGDYLFGYWLIHKVFMWNPKWVIPLAKIFGSGNVCIWSFLIGGNILGIVSALICYPIMFFLFNKFCSSRAGCSVEK